MSNSNDVLILSGVRTAIGAFGGSLKSVRGPHLAAAVIGVSLQYACGGNIVVFQTSYISPITLLIQITVRSQGMWRRLDYTFFCRTEPFFFAEPNRFYSN